tara:strand:- start:1049 stop:1240 length:192 start_codon:yes stop_codon:yes gene_type:complete
MITLNGKGAQAATLFLSLESLMTCRELRAGAGDPTVIGGKYLLNQEALMLQEKDLTKGITIML